MAGPVNQQAATALTEQHLALMVFKDAWAVVAAADFQVVQETVVKEAAAAVMAIIKVVVVVVLAVGAVIQQLTQTITTDQELPMMYQAKGTALVATVF